MFWTACVPIGDPAEDASTAATLMSPCLCEQSGKGSFGSPDKEGRMRGAAPGTWMLGVSFRLRRRGRWRMPDPGGVRLLERPSLLMRAAIMAPVWPRPGHRRKPAGCWLWCAPRLLHTLVSAANLLLRVTSRRLKNRLMCERRRLSTLAMINTILPSGRRIPQATLIAIA